MNIKKELEHLSISAVVWLKFAALAILCMYVITHQSNLLPDWIYYTLIGIGFVSQIYLVTQKDGEKYSLIINYVIITFVLFGKDMTVAANTWLLCYPLVEVLIFNRRYVNEIWTLMISLFISSVIIFASVGFPVVHRPFLGTVWLVEFMLWFACMYVCSKAKWEEKERLISNNIDDYFRTNNLTDGLHKVYRRLISKWNRQGGDFKIENISTYFEGKNGFVLVNSSFFKWDRQLDLDAETIANMLDMKPVRKEQGVSSHPDKGILMLSYLVPVKVKGHNSEERLYIVKYDAVCKRGVFFLEKRCLERLFRNLAWRIVNFVTLANSVKRQEDEYVQQYKMHKAYVDKAIGTLHFIRNRLSSFSNLVAVNNLPPEERDLITPKQYRDLNKAVKNDYDNILRYAENLLDREKYPFSDFDVEDIPVEKIYLYLSEHVEEHLHTFVNVDNVIDPKKWYVTGNLFEIKTIITDWVSNMRKYGKDFCIDWMLEEKELRITFLNAKGDGETWALENVADALSLVTPEIRHARKYTFGIIQIRTLAEKNNIKVSAEVKAIENTKFLRVELKLTLCNGEEYISD